MQNFSTGEILQTALYAAIAYAGGLCVLIKNVKVNYTRKINFFALYIIPFIVDRVFPF
jgi:hypothetical protein